MCAGIKLTVIIAVPYCFPLLCADRYLPDGDLGDERAVPLFSFCVRAGIYLRVIMAMSGTTMSDTFVFLLCSGRCLPDGDHGDVRAVPVFSFRFRAGIYLRVIMAMSGTAMSRTSVFLLFSSRYLPDCDHGDECAVLCFPSVCGQVFT